MKSSQMEEFKRCNGVCESHSAETCLNERKCNKCSLNEDRLILSALQKKFATRCCRACVAREKINEERETGFEPHDSEGFYRNTKEIEDITTIIRLDEYTCSERAARYFREMQRYSTDIFNRFDRLNVSSFDEGVSELRERPNAALLVPHLHPIQKELSNDRDFRELTSKTFDLLNPPLLIARPKNPFPSNKRYLFALPALLPLVKRAYKGDIPFREIVPCNSTTAAAEQCSKIFGGGHCTVNDGHLDLFRLTPVTELPKKIVTWRLYANNH